MFHFKILTHDVVVVGNEDLQIFDEHGGGTSVKKKGI